MIFDIKDQVMSSYSPTAVASAFQNYIDRIKAMEDGVGTPLAMYIFQVLFIFQNAPRPPLELPPCSSRPLATPAIRPSPRAT